MLADKTVAKKPKRSTLAAKFLFAAVWLVLLAEVVPRVLFSPYFILHTPSRRLLGKDDSSWRITWVALHPLHREWTGRWAAFHPTRGWAVLPNIKNMTPFGDTDRVVNTNSKGLRGETEYEYARTPGKQRIVVLGDSFTFGTEVNDNETYARYLQSDLPNTEVLNLGVAAYGHDQMLLYLKEEGVKYHPDVVILGFVFIDIYRNISSFFAYAKPKFEISSEGLKLTNVPVPTPEEMLAREPYRSKAIDVGVILREKVRWISGINEQRARAITTPILDDVVATTRGIGAVPVFVYMPI